MRVSKELTSQHEKVLALLRKAHRPLTAYEILDALSDDGFRAPPTAYRALEALIKRGLVHKIESLNAFVACAHDCAQGGDVAHTSSFAICTSCGAVDEVEDDGLSKAMVKASKGFLDKVERETVEIKGVCRTCTAKQKES